MTLTLFEDVTKPLTTEEAALIKEFIDIVMTGTPKKPIYSREIEEALDIKGIKVRKLANWIRCNGMKPLIASSKGYYFSFDDLPKQIKSLRERAESINATAEGLSWLKERYFKCGYCKNIHIHGAITGYCGKKRKEVIILDPSCEDYSYSKEKRDL